MDALQIDTQRDFVTRQYAHLVAGGLDEAGARTRLRDVLGTPALDFLGGPDSDGGPAASGDDDIAARLVAATRRLGGSAANAHVALIHSLDEARLFALDWWRPIRTFLLYVVFLLALAVIVTILYSVAVLPAFRTLDQAVGVHGGAASWITRHGAVRLFAPLAVMAVALVLLATLWWRMRRCMARLAPLAGQVRCAWLYGRSGARYQTLRWLEFAAALHAAGIPDAAVPEAASELTAGATRRAHPGGDTPLRDRLGRAAALGTFDAELDWQRRLHWSATQAQLELARDRLMLISRVLFYVLIGIVVTVLYIPIFTVASTFGVH